MATQRRFEGKTLADVLAKVQNEMGPDAKIAKAQRMRKGGVFGFFQSERFEVLVEEGDGTSSASSESTSDSTGDSIGDSTEPPPAAADKIPNEPVMEPRSVASPEMEEPPFTAASLLELAEQISKEESDRRAEKATITHDKPVESAWVPEPEPEPEPESELEPEPEFETAFEQTAELEPEPEVESEVAFEPASEVTPELTSELASEVLTPEIADAPESVLAQEGEPKISTETDSFAEVLSRVAYQADMKSDPTTNVDERTIDMTPITPTPTSTPIADDRPAFLDVRPTDVEVAEVEVATATTQLPAPPFRTRASDHPLSVLGLPTGLIPANVDLTELEKALAISLERLPEAPTIKPSKGSVIAVVGELLESLELAEDLAHKWGRPIEEVVLASQLYKGRGDNDVLRNVRSAEDARRSWSRRPRPTIVAIDAYPGSRDTSWAEHILTALEPIATYGVADATRKAEDIAAWASQLGGVDCLAVNHLEETVSPASILATGIPVERIDGRKATPAYWAMLLAERLTAA